MSDRGMAETKRRLWFPEGTIIDFKMSRRPVSELKKYLHPLSGSAPKRADLSISITDFWFNIELDRYREGEKYLQQFRRDRNKISLLYPFPVFSKSRIYCIPGPRTNIINYNNSQHGWSGFVAFFLHESEIELKDVNDEQRPRTTSTFNFPSELNEFDIVLEGTESSVIDGPISHLADNISDPSRIHFFRKQRTYLNFQPSYAQYYSGKFPGQFVCVNLMKLSAIYGNMKKIPTLQFRLTWAVKAPENMFLMLYGFSMGGITLNPREEHHRVMAEPDPPAIS